MLSFYEKNSVIAPEVVNQDIRESSKKTKSYRYVIDSKSRDKTKYPKPSHYKVPLHSNLTNVVSVELVSADVPFPFYLIRDKRDIICINEGNGNINVKLDHGDYTALELSEELQAALNNYGNATYKVVYDSRKKLFVISSDLIDKNSGGSLTFCIDGSCTKDSCATILGFDNNKYVADSFGIIISPFMIDLRKESYIAMKIFGAKAIQSIESGVHETFAIIPQNYNETNMRSFASSSRNIKFFNPIRADIHDLELLFVDRNGNEVDFQNQDHVIELNFEIYIQELSYGNIFI
jgi:hypothetical protein